MNAIKVLKLKNRLAGEIARLKGLMAQNSYIEGRLTQPYPVKDIVFNLLPQRITELVALKTALCVHNGGGGYSKTCDDTPAWAIFMIAEYKGFIESLRAMPTAEGKDVETHGFLSRDTASVPVERKCHVTQVEVDGLVKMYEANIDKLQDFLDARNAEAVMHDLDNIKI